VLTCRTVKRMFVDYLGEGLPAEYRELIEEHLAVCPNCTSSADSYRAVIRLARRLPPAPVPPELLESLRQAAREMGIPLPDRPE
jgi:predicted anti-sigma-YlaC factor YlaD